MKGFNPGQLMPPTAVNPKTVAKTAWEIRVNHETKRVSFTGLIQTLDLQNHGIKYSFDNPADPTGVVVWTVSKEDAMTIKGTNAEGKMGSLVALLEKLDLVKEDEEVIYFKLNEIEGYPGYYEMVLDPDNPAQLYTPKEEGNTEESIDLGSSEPTEEEISKSVVEEDF